jgi:polyisoprenoid-binding protein YceI
MLPTVRDVLGREPRTFAGWAADHATAFGARTRRCGSLRTIPISFEEIRMSAPQNALADLAGIAQRSQAAASDVFEAWTTTVQAVGDAAGSQASSFRRLARGMFDLADQAVVVERELATFLTVNAQVSAATLDSFRKLTDTATAALEDVARTTAWAR